MKFSPTTRGFYDESIHGATIPADAVDVTLEQHAALMEAQATGQTIQPDSSGFPVAVDPPLPSLDELKLALTASVQARLDAVAQMRGYDTAASCISYFYSTNQTFAAEANAILAWRDAVWVHCIDLLDQVTSGATQVPTEAELLAGLPQAPW